MRGFLLSGFTMSFSRPPNPKNAPGGCQPSQFTVTLDSRNNRTSLANQCLMRSPLYRMDNWQQQSQILGVTYLFPPFGTQGSRGLAVPSSMELSCRTLFYLIILLRHVSLCRSGWSQICYILQPDNKCIAILLTHPPKCCNKPYRHEPAHLIKVTLTDLGSKGSCLEENKVTLPTPHPN